MKRLLFGFFAFTLMAALSAPAQATALSLLSPDGEVDKLLDEDYESVVPIAPGEFAFVGVFELGSIDGTTVGGVGTSSFTGVIAAKVQGVFNNVDELLSGPVTFGALSDTEFNTAMTLLGVPALGIPNRVNSSSAILVYDNANSPAPFLAIADSNTQADGIASAIAGSPVVEFGFIGDTYAQATMGANDAGDVTFSFSLALNVTHNHHPELTYLQVSSPESGFGKQGGGALPLTALHVSGTGAQENEFGGSDEGDPGPWMFKTDANMAVNVVPEPSTMTMFAIFGGGLMAIGYRRRASRKQA